MPNLPLNPVPRRLCKKFLVVSSNFRLKYNRLGGKLNFLTPPLFDSLLRSTFMPCGGVPLRLMRTYVVYYMVNLLL